jgi:DnaK suppressor protein
MTLSKKDRDTLRAALEAKRKELVRAHDENLEPVTHPAEESFADPMDAATRSTEEAELLGLARQERAELAEVDRALAKFDHGTYGVSELSGRPIDVERLRAIPWARLTADEQEKVARR